VIPSEICNVDQSRKNSVGADRREVISKTFNPFRHKTDRRTETLSTANSALKHSIARVEMTY